MQFFHKLLGSRGESVKQEHAHPLPLKWIPLLTLILIPLMARHIPRRPREAYPFLERPPPCRGIHSPVFSSVWLLSTVSIWGCAVALAVASSAAGVVVAVVSAAGTSACLGSSLSWASSAFKDGELSVEALVALSVSAAAAAADFSSEEAAGVAACGAGCSEPVSAAPSPFFSSAGALLSLLPSSSWALSAAAASVAAGASLSLFSAAPPAGPSSFLSAASLSDAGASPFFSPLSFFLVMCPRKLAWILVAALWALSSGLMPSCSIFWSPSSFFSTLEREQGRKAGEKTGR